MEVESRISLDRCLLATMAIVAAALLVVSYQIPIYLQYTLIANISISLLCFFTTTSIVGSMDDMFLNANLCGIDLNKITTKRDESGELIRPIVGIRIPESQGTIAATVYILLLSFFIPFAFAGYTEQSNFPHERLSEYLGTLLSVALATFMGFADDVLDLRWRHKIPLPFLANLPLLLVYYAAGGLTGVAVPNQLRWLLGSYLELHGFFFLVLLLFAVFSTHAINILGGVSSFKVRKSVVIAVSVFCLNVIQIVRSSQENKYQHVQSLFLILPFIATSVALLRKNWFPARVFVGGAYPYFAGAIFAAVSIVGHFSKTMWLLLVPQLLNFAYTLPQLVRRTGIPCPRHRMPAFDVKQGLVKNSYCEFDAKALPLIGKLVFLVITTFRLAHVIENTNNLPTLQENILKQKQKNQNGSDQQSGSKWVRMSNLTLINFFLYAFGSCREDELCCRLLAFQGSCALLTFGVRFGLASVLYDEVS